MPVLDAAAVEVDLTAVIRLDEPEAFRREELADTAVRRPLGKLHGARRRLG